ncbi:hypothetical protein [Alsobacter sp. SYSU BS001988]
MSIDYAVKGGAGLTLTLQLDTDPGVGVSYVTLTKAAGSTFWANAAGAPVIGDDAGTPDAFGNSENAAFGFWLGTPNVAAGDYDVVLTALDGVKVVAQNHISIHAADLLAA